MKHFGFAWVFLFAVSCMLPAQTGPVPFINQPLVPDAVPPGNGGFTLTVHGAGFTPNSVVKWKGSARPTVVLSNSLLQATIKASDVAKPDSVFVTVVNVDTGNETSDVAWFLVRQPTPSVALIATPTFSGTGFNVSGYFNNDHKLDVAVCNSDSRGLVVDMYLGEGELKFQPPIETVIKGKLQIAGSVFAGDFNGDHNLDLFVRFTRNGRSQFAILFGDGKGKFKLGPSTSIYKNLNIFPAGDVSGDGNLDILTTWVDKYQEAYLNVLFGKGDGTFTAGGGITSLNGLFNTPTVGDFNEDGNLDLAAPLNDNQGSILVALNQGGGKFVKTVTYQTSSPTYSLVVADVNGDGHLDIVADNGAVLLGKGDGTFTNGQATASGISVTGDFNGDGKLDLLSPGYPSLLLLGNGDGTFQPAISTAYGFGAGVGNATGAFKPDGRLDLVGGGLFWQVPAGLYPPNLPFGQQKVGTQSPPQTATVVNADRLPLPVTGITINGTNSTDFSQTNNCPSSIPVGGSCQIQVTFAPNTQGDKSASLSASYTGPGSPQSVALTGTGVGTKTTSVSLTPSQLSFATRMVNTTSPPQTATLTNTGSTDVSVYDISTALPFSQTNNCPSTLSVGQNCQIQVTFDPTSIGLANGTLSVTDNAPDSPQTVALSGVGTKITLPIGVHFGNQKVGTSSNPVPVILSNQGTVTLNISQIAMGGTNPGDFSQTNNCGSSVPPGDQCTIQVTFSPTHKGTRSAELQVYDDVEPSPQAVALGGTGT